MSESGVAYPEDQDPNKISILDIGDTVLIQQGDEIPVDFISAEVGTVIDTKWDLYSYSVSYADATQNFRFTKARKTFNVAVKVYDDTVAGEGTNGDSGSENLFYFQILFENGCSGYVLANRQIKGDSFVSGDTANFQISTNADYGNIIGIRIIPDDSSDNNKKYDKLNVDSIRISELGVTGTHTVWVADNVGWIDIGYTEEMEKNGLGGRPGRTEADLSKTLNIDYTTSAIQLEIAIRTISGDQMEGAADQYRGTLSVDVNYIKNNGEHDHTGAKDAVSLMYQYMNKKGSGDAGGTVSQISSMFRENHTDRFFIELEDVQKLVSLDLSMVQKDDPYTWNIGGVSIRMITDVGKLRLNAYDEYEYQREEEPPILCIQRSETVPAYHPWLTKDGQQKLNIPLTDNKIEIYDNYSTKISAVAREPASKNDELNIFLFPNMTESNPMDEYDLDVLVHYAHVYGNIYQTGGRLSKYTPPAKSTNSPMFYIHGLKASGMVDLNSLVVSADSEHPYTNMAVLDHAVVQQVRNGVVVKNYYIDLKNGNAFYTVREYPSSNAAAVGYQDSQVLTFQLGENTVAKNLFAEKIDMAVALRYKVENDPSDIEYLTPYIYLTDQNVVKIRDGQMVDITFNNMFMGEITGINVAAVGDVTAGIEGACIACYRKDSQGNTDEIGYYSFGNPVTVTPGNVVSMKQTANTETDKNSVRPVTITFDTSVASNLYESGTADPVWMQVYTVDADGNIDDTTVFEDIKKYLTDGAKSFATDKVQSIRFLVKGAQSLRRIIVEPKSNSAAGNAGWSLDSVVVKLGNDDPITRSVNERVTEGTPKTITLSNISVQAEVYYKFEAGQKSYTQERVKEDGKKLVALHEDMFVILPYIYGSELGNTVSVVEVTDDGYESGLLTDLLVKDNDNRYVFTPPKSETTKNYKITVASSEVPQANINIYVKVVGVEPPKTEPENTEGTEESGKTGETGENGQTGNTGETGETGNTGESGEDSKSEDREGDSENDTNNAEDTPAVVIHIGGGEEP
ncbi:MAG: hypothetical protein J6Z02_02715 [Lachnospiraceae bacterium]|nr:hypothetical protein [Lachnospiraceae bacterium]